jgi:hypothetical protein
MLNVRDCEKAEKWMILAIRICKGGAQGKGINGLIGEGTEGDAVTRDMLSGGIGKL